MNDHSWGDVLRGGIGLACDAQRVSVMEAGRRVLHAIFLPPAHPGDVKFLKEKWLLLAVKDVVDREDDYAVRNLVTALIGIEALPLAGLRAWLEAAANAEVRELASECREGP